MPKRVQRKRVKGWRMPENAVNVARPSRFSNPFKIGETCLYDGHWVLAETAEDAVKFFRDYMERQLYLNPDSTQAGLEALRGKDLACWCDLDKPCHADVLLELANGQDLKL